MQKRGEVMARKGEFKLGEVLRSRVTNWGGQDPASCPGQWVVSSRGKGTGEAAATAVASEEVAIVRWML